MLEAWSANVQGKGPRSSPGKNKEHGFCGIGGHAAFVK